MSAESARPAFRVESRDGDARTGRLETRHGRVHTPAFMPVATYAAVRGVSPDELRAAGAQILLANTYHLHERPGERLIESQGGLHGFSGWSGPWLTDSGGFQVTSLADKVRVDEDGVTFASPLDGAKRQLTPESVIEIQRALGSDIVMVLDECVPPGDSIRARAAMERTLRWAERAARTPLATHQWRFGIVQGGESLELRIRSARATRDLGFDGFAHGGLGLGEEPERRNELVAATHAELPEASPRYLMGLGRPADLVDAIAAGVDLFDCVIPTRHARHGVLFTGAGLLRLRNARFRDDSSPPDPECDCATCAGFSRAYLAHLLRSGEALGARLASVHNLRFYLGLMERAREAIRTGRFADLRDRIVQLGGASVD